LGPCLSQCLALIGGKLRWAKITQRLAIHMIPRVWWWWCQRWIHSAPAGTAVDRPPRLVHQRSDSSHLANRTRRRLRSSVHRVLVDDSSVRPVRVRLLRVRGRHGVSTASAFRLLARPLSGAITGLPPALRSRRVASRETVPQFIKVDEGVVIRLLVRRQEVGVPSAFRHACTGRVQTSTDCAVWARSNLLFDRG